MIKFITSPAVAGNGLVSYGYDTFLSEAQQQGFTEMLKLLNPKEGKAPVIMLMNKATNQNITLVLSKSGAEKVRSGEDIANSQVIEGKNANGESRYYLAFGGETIAVEQEVARAKAVRLQLPSNLKPAL